MDLIQYRLELLKMARELALNEYIDQRAQDHNKWLADCDVAWRTQRVKLPYPAFPAYPDEQDILDKALSLHNFLDTTKEKTSNEVLIPDVVEITEPMIDNVVSTVETTIGELTTQNQQKPVKNDEKSNRFLSKIEELRTSMGLK